MSRKPSRLPSYVDVGAKIASGQYTGNNGINRAVAHDLGVTPKVVLIHVADKWWRITDQTAAIYYSLAAAKASYAVTGVDSTNFYVGAAASLANSANLNTIVYDWVAIG